MKTIEGYTYAVDQHIGKGYSSTVHKGVQDSTRRPVSLKVIEMAKLQDPINQRLLQLEVQALQTLSHSPHVLQLLDVYATQNNTYLITQLCDGDLSSMLKKRRTLPYLQAVQILRQLIQGYISIHRAGFLHRDIKPANILFKEGEYKYADFGFAIPISDLPNHKDYNVGSPVYMPPEALKENNYSVSCDIWAIGVIFYQLVKGVVPWRALSEKVLYEKIMSQPLAGLTVGMPEVSRRFLAEVLCLDPKGRLTPDQMLNWPSKLQQVNTQIRHLSPFQPRGRVIIAPLRQININVPSTPTTPSIINFSNFHNNQGENSSINSMLKSKSQDQSIGPSMSENRQEEVQFKEQYFFANNWINYIKFLHRILKFVDLVTPMNMQAISQSLAKTLFVQIDELKRTMSQDLGDIKFDNWRGFLASIKAQTLRKKVNRYQNKYKMFHESGTSQKVQGKAVFDAINQIITYLNIQGFIPRLVIAADYLTTFYQLLHLRQKYDSVDFMRLSKIDLIMQGNPYNITEDHFQKLKKKLLLIQP